MHAPIIPSSAYKFYTEQLDKAEQIDKSSSIWKIKGSLFNPLLAAIKTKCIVLPKTKKDTVK